MKAHIPHFVAFWEWSRGKRLAVLAGIFAAAEFVVTSGYRLPYSDEIPQGARLTIIALIIVLRVYLGWRAQRETK